MSSVWFVIPSKRPVPEANACVGAWQDMGYRVAVVREPADGTLDVNFQIPTKSYMGWPRSVNMLVAQIMAYDPSAEWFVSGGDDYWPDPNKRADEIATECRLYFHEDFCKTHHGHTMPDDPGWKACRERATFGVMQPTGDRWSEGRCTTCGGGGWTVGFKLERIECPDCQGKGISAVIDRIAGSPWMGREFCRRMYHGSGPMYNGYHHNFADEELQQVARKLGVFWQRRDLVQEHRHWARPRGDWKDAPEWAHAINNPAQSDWDKSKALFAARKAAGFPGHEPLEI